MKQHVSILETKLKQFNRAICVLKLHAPSAIIQNYETKPISTKMSSQNRPVTNEK
jgi:hypothetical protein